MATLQSMSLFDTSVRRLDGTPATLGDLAGPRATLLVNVASRCGLTPQYSGLEQLHEKYAGRGYQPEPDAWEGPGAGGLATFSPDKALAWFDFPNDVTRFRFGT